MNKEEFLTRLRTALDGLPREDIDERAAFYSEMIDDRVEAGLSEEEAVGGLDSIEDIASKTVADIPLTRLVREKIEPENKLAWWQIVLIVLGFPLWFSLLLAAFSAVLAVYISVWAIIVSLWAVEFSLGICALAFVPASVLLAVMGELAGMLFLLGCALVCAGVSIFGFFGCLAASKGVVSLTKKLALWFKSLFIRKESSK